MYDHRIHYCFILSEEQMKYLRSKKYKKAMRLQLSRTFPMLQYFSLLATSMPLRPCPNLVEVVAVQRLNLIGAKRMTRTNVPLLPMPPDGSFHV